MSQPSPEVLVSLAALSGSMASLAMVAQAGLASPELIDSALDQMAQWLDQLPPELESNILTQFDSDAALIKQVASKKWQKRDD